MRCIVLVRYSVWTLAGRTSWRIGRNPDPRAYREALFHPDRLGAHEFLFERLTLPSIVSQTRPPAEDWFRLVVFTSTELPQPNRVNLEAMLAPHPWTRLVPMEPDEPYDLCRIVSGIAREFASGSDEPFLFATARMVALDWNLFIENRQALAGGLGNPVTISPGVTADLPLTVHVDLVQLGSGGARDLFDLGLAIAGRGTLQKDLRIELAPTIETPLGPMRYAMPVTVRRSTDVTRASE